MWDSHSEVDKATGAAKLHKNNYVVCMLSTRVTNLYFDTHGAAQQQLYTFL